MNLFTIPSGVPFLQALADGLATRIDRADRSQALILLPTRRACQNLRTALLEREARQGDYALLMPQIRPLGEPDEDALFVLGDAALAEKLMALPPAMPAALRRHILAELILKKEVPPMTMAQAFKLAGDLAALLDAVLIEELDFSHLHALVPDDYAEHWQVIISFLDIVQSAWPALLKVHGMVDAVTRRTALMDVLRTHWEIARPEHPIIAAGSTGSQPATARFLKAIAGLPHGAVILPGLDVHLEEEAWLALEASHPQYLMGRLLEKFGVVREDVKPWLTQKIMPPRAVFLSEVMRPAACTEQWRHLDQAGIGQNPWQGMQQLALANEHEEALAAALLLRATLEENDKTAALVTPDRALAARVAALMRRWGIALDDSAGTPLAHTLLGSFFSLVHQASKADVTPSTLIALFKHPFTTLGVGRACCVTVARTLEKYFFRSAVRGVGLARWRAALESENNPVLQEAIPLLRTLSDALAPFQEVREQPLALWAAAHKKAAEALAVGGEALWRGAAGEALAKIFEDMQQQTGTMPHSFADYVAVFDETLRSVSIHAAYGQHPRLVILGLLEARLLETDVIILAGLNEGVWPQTAPPDPWMSAAMRQKFGLPVPDQTVGLMAHDFVQLAAQPNVYLLRSLRRGSAPTVPSRWLLRLEAVLAMMGASDALTTQKPWALWARALDEADVFLPCTAPAVSVSPCFLPKEISVSDIGLWVADPYAFYTKKVLGLKKLGALDAEFTERERGTIIHAALESVSRAYVKAWPKEAEHFFFEKVMEGMRGLGLDDDALSLLRPRLQALAARYWIYEDEHRRCILRSYAEAKGAVDVELPSYSFRLTARADRIDVFPDQTRAVLDYKTGQPPTRDSVTLGLKPQLVLEAMIADEGGFTDAQGGPVTEIGVLRMGDGRADIKTKPISRAEAGLEETRAGLTAFVAAFLDEAALFHAAPRPQLLPASADYGRLARLAEWSKGALYQAEAEE